VYLIRDLRGLLYVGRSENLRQRFFQHLDNSHNELLRLAIARPWGEARFAWIRVEAPAPLEARLIAHLLPICNERRYGSVRDRSTINHTTH
jgi:excinuclease UvrABC nuclease subunit